MPRTPSTPQNLYIGSAHCKANITCTRALPTCLKAPATTSLTLPTPRAPSVRATHSSSSPHPEVQSPHCIITGHGRTPCQNFAPCPSESRARSQARIGGGRRRWYPEVSRCIASAHSVSSESRHLVAPYTKVSAGHAVAPALALALALAQAHITHLAKSVPDVLYQRHRQIGQLTV
eukprot:2780025-Rhodomonas_salina.3